MKTRMLILLAALFMVSTPAALMAMEHGHDAMKHMDHKSDEHQSHEGMEHESMGHDAHGDMGHKSMEHGNMEHGGMAMEGDMIMLGNSVEDGVKAMAHLKDVSEAMAEMGMKETHHFMVMFVDEATGEAINEGVVAVKVTDPAGQEAEAVRLMGMQGHFGADVVLSQSGHYVFKVGTKLADGTKRTFEFSFDK